MQAFEIKARKTLCEPYFIEYLPKYNIISVWFIFHLLVLFAYPNDQKYFATL